MPASGYSVPHLREVISSGTLIYIRPMKSVLSMDKGVEGLSADSPTTVCQSCNKEIPLFNLRVHEELCSNTVKADLVCDEIEEIVEELPGSSGQDDDWTQKLRSIFPDVSKDDLDEVKNSAMTIDEAAACLAEKTKESKADRKDVTFEILLQDFFKQRTSMEEQEIKVNRDSIWVGLLKFYKKCLSNPKKLQKELTVSFDNEAGLDGGAMKVEMFSLAQREIKNRLFEGEEPYMVPVKDATKGILFQIAGTIISHGILQRGSVGFPVLAPHIYGYIVGDDMDQITSTMRKDCIPLNASTVLLHNFLALLENCRNSADIENILEGNEKSEAFWQLINCSRWPNERVINIDTKEFLIQHLICNELLSSRKNELDDFKKGLETLGFLKLVQQNKDKLKVLFCKTDDMPLTAQRFNDMTQEIVPSNFSERQATEWFKSYLEQEENIEFPGDGRLATLLKFCTGWATIPFGCLTSKIKVTFLPDDEGDSLPTASACTSLIRIPTCHSSKKGFFKAMDVALKYASEGFPNP